VDFTREPIIETIITPREGNKLLIRSSRGTSHEEYTVDSVEVVSFGHALFFRSTERPKPFLVPVSDYEVVETKEARVMLKTGHIEKTIKIGGGRSAGMRREKPEEENVEDEEPISEEEPQEEPSEQPSESQPQRSQERFGGGRRRDRRRGRHRRDYEPQQQQATGQEPQEPSQETPPTTPPPATMFSHLIPPPTRLISETLAPYKEAQSEPAPQPPEHHEEKKEDDRPPSGDATLDPMNRVSFPNNATSSIMSTQSLPLDWNRF
jgi:hypothetical protein